MPFNSLAALLTVALMVAVIVLSEYHLVPGRASRKGRYIIYFVLMMMASMFLGLIFYLLNTRNCAYKVFQYYRWYKFPA